MTKKRVILGICPLVVLAIAWAVHSLNAPSEGVLSTPATTQTASSKQKAVYKEIDSSSFNMQYPDYFTDHPTDQPRLPILETYDFTATTKGIWELAVQLESLPSGNLSDESAYHFREVHPERFTKATMSINGNQVPYIDDDHADQGFSRSAFLVHDGKVVVVTLSGQKSPEIESVYLHALQSFVWK